MKTHFIFRILEHPDDAYDGKPRGHKEMVKNLNMLNLQKNDIFVSDKWLATRSAVKSIRHERHFSASDLNHEVVNHSKGETKNGNGFTTNPIESKWALIKRWIRFRTSGICPTHSDRQKLRLLVNEYQARNIQKARAPQSFDHGHITTVQFREILQIYRCD